MKVWLLEAGFEDDHTAAGFVLAPAQLPNQSDFGGPLPILDGAPAIPPLNAFGPNYTDTGSETLTHLRRRPPLPLPPEDAEWSSEYDAGAREEPPYHSYYFRRIGFFETLLDFREPSRIPPSANGSGWSEQERDPDVEHISWFDDTQKRSILLL
jgi:hypothetical protein